MLDLLYLKGYINFVFSTAMIPVLCDGKIQLKAKDALGQACIETKELEDFN